MTGAPGCERFRGLLAEDALGGLDRICRAELQGHLVGCPECRAETDELTGTAGALAWVDPSAAGELARPDVAATHAVPTPALDEAVAEILTRGTEPELRPPPSQDGMRSPPRRLAKVLVPVLAVAAAGLLVVGAVGLSRHAAPTTRSVALSGPGGAHASAVLTAETWGTSVTLTQPAERWGEVLTVSMASDYGQPWNAGSYWVGTSRGVTVVLACALPVDRIRTIAVSDAAGRVVLAGRQARAPTGG